MRPQRWEELPEELLVEVFGKVDMELLANSVLFVCKSWYKASLAPQLWHEIIFTKLPSKQSVSHLRINPRWIAKDDGVNLSRASIELEKNDIIQAYIKFLITRSRQSATKVWFQGHWRWQVEQWRPDYVIWQVKQQTLDCVAEGCPFLKELVIDMDNEHMLTGKECDNLQLSGFICKWKNLETLDIGNGFGLEYIIPQINIHCKNFGNLSVTDDDIDYSIATAITTIPNLKFLCLSGSTIKRENLVILLNGCKKLQRLDVSQCTGFKPDDDEILKLASHISEFECKGSVLYVCFDLCDGLDSSEDDDEVEEDDFLA